MTGFPDTGPREDGTRSQEQWLNCIREDLGIIWSNVKETTEVDSEEVRTLLENALKESRRLTSDIQRLAEEVHEIPRNEL